ncbi:ERF family protein [Weissella sp. MSCH1]|uniref:ERF family protein n=1 Tax=Weissella sp. MSCH1 TaxID=3383343 RepID=UPI00389695DE
MGVATELLKVRKSLVQPVKDASNPQFRSSYVTYDAVVKAVDDAIKASEAGLVWTQEVKDSQLFTVLLTDDDRLDLGGVEIISARQQKGQGWVDASLDPQAQGSGLTYAKRYSLALAFGVASDVDDDANSAQKSYQNRQQSQSKNPLNSKFGAVAKNYQTKHSLTEEEMYKQISAAFKTNIANFYAFNKLNDTQKQQIIDWTSQGLE